MKSNIVKSKGRALPISLGAIAGGLALTAAIVHLTTPRPAALVARSAFKHRRHGKPDDLAQYSLKVQMRSDIDYQSAFSRGAMDVYCPIGEPDHAYPVVFWLHGGGYVGGDKHDAATFCTMLASRGFTVVNVDYAQAPEFCYPTPVLQLGEAYRYVAAHADRLGADMGRVAFGGDSTGGQIAGQFVNIQVNPEYAQLVSIPANVEDPASIKAAVFFCTPFNMRRFDYLSNRDGVPAASPVPMVGRLAWSYFKNRLWRSSNEVRLAGLLDTANEDFPPTYLTDSASFSFVPQAAEMISKLKLLDVEVLGYLPGTELGGGKDAAQVRRGLPHNYQYNMKLPRAFRNFELASSFLRDHLR